MLFNLTFKIWQGPGCYRSPMKGCSKAIVLCPVPRDLFFCIPSWRGICQRKWWSSSLHVTRWNSILNCWDIFRWIALISMESKSSWKGQVRSLASAKQRRESCYVLMLLLVGLIFLTWYISFVYQVMLEFLIAVMVLLFFVFQLFAVICCFVAFSHCYCYCKYIKILYWPYMKLKNAHMHIHNVRAWPENQNYYII